MSDYDYSRYTPKDNTNNYSPFRSAYKNIRFALSVVGSYPVDDSDMANLVGIAFKIYGDVSLWRMLLAFNGISNQVQQVYPGLILTYPSKSAVIAYLSQQQTNKSVTLTI